MRKWCRTLAAAAAVVIAVPFLVPYFLTWLLKGRDNAVRDTSELAALLPGTGGRYVRTGVLRLTIAACHSTAQVCFGTTFSKYGARLGPNVYIGSYCSIGMATIGADALLANGVCVTSGAHQHGIEDVTRPIAVQPGRLRRVTIGDGCWIASHAVIMDDVGKGAVVAAGAVVTKPVPDFAIVGGVPARVLKSRLPATSTETPRETRAT